ncbi:Uma2 family endonuclease [Phormidium sp. LEGE 05292]|uniref:Uma2 family endonuclease n=1 Tax=[Phormidium] sp. LEGE 05292 TaxID=767427 RepID=UPI0018800B2F|nr:Uma2 family endonuclease [Phormidium sp. LEGE 05292]MBE9226087.1 Uma2 family endonuclease [Phormidium sp. LEGE 05292]
MSENIQPQTSLEDFFKLPETNPVSEFIKGEIIQKPIRQAEHSLLQLEICEAINRVAKTQKIAIAFPELRCTFGGESIVPDVSVFRRERIPLQSSGRIAQRFEIYPDWAIEILSPEQKQIFVLKKLLHYSQNGTDLGWLIDSETESILAIFPGQQVEIFQGATQLPVISGIPLELTAKQIFNWLTLS